MINSSNNFYDHQISKAEAELKSDKIYTDQISQNLIGQQGNDGSFKFVSQANECGDSTGEEEKGEKWGENEDRLEQSPLPDSPLGPSPPFDLYPPEFEHYRISLLLPERDVYQNFEIPALNELDIIALQQQQSHATNFLQAAEKFSFQKLIEQRLHNQQTQLTVAAQSPQTIQVRPQAQPQTQPQRISLQALPTDSQIHLYPIQLAANDQLIEVNSEPKLQYGTLISGSNILECPDLEFQNQNKNPEIKSEISKNKSTRSAAQNTRRRKQKQEAYENQSSADLSTQDSFQKRRTPYTKDQTDALEVEFRKNQFIIKNDREIVADRLGLTDRQVKIWFQNRRMKEKRIQGRGDGVKSKNSGSSYGDFGEDSRSSFV